MNNRLTIHDLAGLLSGKAGKSAEEIEVFLKEFASLTSDSVFTDRLVQVKGIGNFKIIRVEKRESIDVNTKERIVIPEHYKLTFAPDKDMRDVVNKPFSLFESIEIAGDADIPAEESADISTDEDTEDDDYTSTEESPAAPLPTPTESPLTSTEPTPPPTAPPPTPTESPLTSTEPTPPPAAPLLTPTEVTLTSTEPPLTPAIPPFAPVIEEVSQMTETPLTTETPDTADTVVPADENDITEHKTPGDSAIKYEEIEFKQRIRFKEMANYNENSTNRPFSEKEDYRSNDGGNNTLIILMSVVVVVLIVALVSVLFIAKDTIFHSNKPDESSPIENQANQFSLPEIDDSEFEDEWGMDDMPAVAPEEIESVPEHVTAAEPAKVSPRKTSAATVRVARGDRLNLFALEYYGNKVFWVYIYQHNRSKLNDPDNIPVGIELQIPASSDYNIDASSPASVRKASVLQSQILSTYRRNISSSRPSPSYGSSYNGSPSYGSSYGSSPSYGSSSYNSTPSYGGSSYNNGPSYGSSSSYNSGSSSYNSSSPSYGSSPSQSYSYPSYQDNYGAQPSYPQNSYDNQSNNYETGQSYGGNTYNNTPYDGYDNQSGGSLYDNTNTVPQYNAPAYNNSVTPYY